MAIREILTSEQPILRQKSRKVKKIDSSIQKLIDDMSETMEDAPGVGLAAPQIGVGLRIIVVDVPQEDEDKAEHTRLQLINPEITRSDGEQIGEEGCLSIPGYIGIVKRALNVTVKAQNRKGKDVKIKATGYLSRVLQHEIDHIDGILYTDRIQKPEDLFRLGENHERLPALPEARELAKA